MTREVSIETVREVVAAWTGIPAEQLGASGVNEEHLLRLNESLREQVVGQEHALNALGTALRRRVALGAEDRPIGAFLFVGPSGVGKTETAKALARHLFGSERRLVRFDMSEYSEPHAKARLLGAPPGYVGHQEGGVLTEALKRQRFAVLLFDEVEKAHPQVLTVLLQIMSDGRLTDASGATVDCRHTIVVMTSNLGNAYVHEGAGFRRNRNDPGDGAEPALERETERRAMEAVRQFFPPEFMGRLDEVLVFRRLSSADLREVVRRGLAALGARLGEGVEITASELALRILADQATDADKGARAVQLTLKRQVEPGLMQLRSQGRLSGAACRVRIDINAEGHFAFAVGEPEPAVSTGE